MDSVLNANVDVNQRYRLEYENREQVYRHSFWADWYLVDTQKKTRTLLGGGKTRDAQLSPNGKYVVYGKADKNLYIYKVDFKTEVPITHDGYDPLDESVYLGSDRYNGVSEWLYEEEFGITRLFWFSPDSKLVGFVRLTSKSDYVFAGGENPQAEACVYDIYYKSVKTMQIDYDDVYVPRLRWFLPQQPANSKTPVEACLMVQVLNRDQNEMTVYSCNPKSTTASKLYQEKQRNYYVDYSQFDEWQWLTDGRFIAVSEQGDYRQAWLYNANGQQVRCLTPEERDVTRLYGYDEKNGVLYYQAALTPETRHVYVLNVKKNVTTQLTTEEGVHDARFSADYTKYIDCYQSVTTPNRYTLYTAAGKMVRVVKDNKELLEKWQALALPEKEFFTFDANGHTLHAWVLKPASSPRGEAGRGLPVVMTQYSGPGSQRVLNSWRKRFEYALAAEGYVVVCVDSRGTDARGKAWRAETYMNLGEKEAEDQLAMAQYASTLDYVDANRINMIGWSYGGYQVIRTLMQGNVLINKGIAIAPVTDWRLYDSAYTERYMRRPQVNESGYEAADLTTKAKNLKGELLIMHGMADDNVHPTHTMKMVEALVDAGVDFRMMVYPDDNHFLKKGKHYEDVHRRILRFLNE